MKILIASTFFLVSTVTSANVTLKCNTTNSQFGSFSATLGHWKEFGVLGLRARLDEHKKNGITIKVSDMICEETAIPHPAFPEKELKFRCSDTLQRPTGRYHLDIIGSGTEVRGVLALGWPNGRPRWITDLECAQ
jgi:hypothetical protein